MTSSQSPHSSAASAVWSDESSDSEAPSTPPTDIQEQTEDGDPSYKNSLLREASTIDATQDQKNSKRRRASTQLLAAGPADIRKLLGDGEAGTKFLQKFCCGGGCCMVETLPPDTAKPGFTPVVKPDNDAFDKLHLKIDSLTLDTGLSNIVDLPPTRISFSAAPVESSKNHQTQVNVHPPDYVQPHPPYSVYSAPVFDARMLTKPGAEKRTFHFDIDITDYPKEGGVDFVVGGAIGVCPPNDPAWVDDIFNQLGVPKFLRDKPVTLNTQGGRWPTIWGEDQTRELITTRRELLTWCSDISSVAPTKQLLRLLAEYADAKNEKKILLYLASAQGQAAFCDLRTGPHITLNQLLHAFPSSKPPLEAIFSTLSQLMPRFYSLSNDPHVSSDREGLAGRRLIKNAVTIHETPNWRGGPRTGVGSGYLERIAKQYINDKDHSPTKLHIPMFRGLMANPLSREFVSDGPMMLIGAGVGMAPFRGFILNRLRNANCANKIWLVQGVRDSLLDEIYSGELGTHEKQIKKVVQSRAPPPIDENEEGVVDSEHTKGARGAMITDERKNRKAAKYVQDEVRLQADIVWFVINALDGRIFVCGSTKGMGEGVERALIDVAMDKGNLNFEEAKQFWVQKKEGNQYIAVSHYLSAFPFRYHILMIRRRHGKVACDNLV